MADLATRSTRVLPDHNLPAASPALLVEAAKDFGQIMQGTRKGKLAEDQTLECDFGKFSYKIGTKFLRR